MFDCMKCENHYILDKMVHGFYEIRCKHNAMRDHRVIKCVTEDEFDDIKDGLVAVNPPKQCPFIKEAGYEI